MVIENAEYRATPSIQRHVLLERNAPAAMVFVRREPDWLSETSIGLEAKLPIPEIAVELLLSDIYADGPMQSYVSE